MFCKLEAQRTRRPRSPETKAFEAIFKLGASRTATKETPTSNDTHLQLEVIAELNWEPSVTAAHIGVAANAGVVTLTGEVESYAQKHAAARRVKGVIGVAQEIKVQLPFERERGDDRSRKRSSTAWLGMYPSRPIPSR